jgi:thiamine-phosphate pyrophosphorylase
MRPLDQCHLYTFVDTAYLHDRKPELIARQLCDGGSDLIQLRAKNCGRDEIRRMAETILPITERANVGLVINDHPSIALAVGAPLCHLGQEDFLEAGFSHVPQLSMPSSGLQFGLSTHAPDQARRAAAAGAAYLGIGPVFPTGTKPGAKPVCLDYVRWATTHVTSPWFAIGGIHLGNLDEVLRAGARRICVVSAILNAPDIVKACQEFRERIISSFGSR